MGTHAHATNGKATSKVNTDEVKAKIERLETLEREKASNEAATTALKGEVSRLVEANAKLADQAEQATKGVARSNESAAKDSLKRAHRRAKDVVEIRLASIRQRKEWAESLRHDAEAIIDFAGLAGETAIGEIAVRLKRAAVRREKECEAQLAAHEVNTISDEDDS